MTIHNSDDLKKNQTICIRRASVRTGAMGALAPIDFEQRVPGTRPEMYQAPLQL